MTEREVVAVVPARGGSVGLPGKNLAPFLGRSLIAHTLTVAANAKSVSRVIATTDDPRITDEARATGSEVVTLPAELAGPTNRVIEAVLFTLNQLELSDETVVALLQPSSPLRTAADIEECCELYSAHEDVKSVVQMVTAVDHHPWKSCLLVDGQLVPVHEWSDLEAPRRGLPQLMRPTGGVYTVSAGDLRAHERFFIPEILPQIVPAERAIDVDTLDDLHLAEEHARALGWATFAA